MAKLAHGRAVRAQIIALRAVRCQKYWLSLYIKSMGLVAVLLGCPNNQACLNYRCSNNRSVTVPKSQPECYKNEI